MLNFLLLLLFLLSSRRDLIFLFSNQSHLMMSTTQTVAFLFSLFKTNFYLRCCTFRSFPREQKNMFVDLLLMCDFGILYLSPFDLFFYIGCFLLFLSLCVCVFLESDKKKAEKLQSFSSAHETCCIAMISLFIFMCVKRKKIVKFTSSSIRISFLLICKKSSCSRFLLHANNQ